MKRLIKKIAQWMIVFCFIGVTLVGCAGGDQEIFDSTELEMERLTDEEEEGKQGPTKEKPS